MAFPSGGVLGSVAIAGATVQQYTVPVPTVTATFSSPISITSGKAYAIVASAPDAAGAAWNTGMSWRLWSEASGYTDGGSMQSLNSGSTWSDYGSATQYFHYIAKAGATEKDKPPLTGGSASVYFGNTTWFAQVFTATSSYSLTSLVLEIHKYAIVSAGDLTIAVYGPAPFAPPAGRQTTKRLVAAAQHELWYEDI